MNGANCYLTNLKGDDIMGLSRSKVCRGRQRTDTNLTIYHHFEDEGEKPRVCSRQRLTGPRQFGANKRGASWRLAPTTVMEVVMNRKVRLLFLSAAAALTTLALLLLPPPLALAALAASLVVAPPVLIAAVERWRE